MPALAVVFHVLAVFFMLGGIIGRDATWRQAANAADLPALRPLIKLAHFFEMMVRPSSFVVLASGLFAAWMRGWPILGPLQGSPIRWTFTALLVYLTIIPVIVFVFVPRGNVFQKRLAEAEAAGSVTPALRAAIRDPWVGAARAYEVVMVVVLTWLMVARPF